MDTIEKLADATSTLKNSYISDWQDQGKKVVGYVCSYLPEEVLAAADILPIRITGKGVSDTSRADSYLSRVNCSFVRCCLELGLDGQYDFLDGAAWVNGCDHIRRCYDNWKAKNPRPFMYILPVPHKIFPEGRQWYKEEVGMFKDAVEGHFHVEITPERFSEEVSTYNQTRKLLRELYDLQACAEPSVTGTEVLKILSAGSVMPRPEFNLALGEILKEAESRPGISNSKARLLINGSIMDDPDFIENVEDLGAIVVTDTLCFGARSFWDMTDESGDPFESLIDRYYNHVSCPRMAGEYQNRLKFIKKQIERADVNGVILEHIKFCDLHGTDNALLKKDLQKDGIATLELERQYGPLADAGRIRTRIQAFLERIGG
ncbi:MAG: 2-hydroxyacyl-CoA dehydratase [Deltaproteobacteria bacterium]|nr:2-hydroxyacyl-CoA dehydratase [Deltaproteobacteria bacterium]